MTLLSSKRKAPASTLNLFLAMLTRYEAKWLKNAQGWCTLLTAVRAGTLLLPLNNYSLLIYMVNLKIGTQIAIYMAKDE